MAVAVSVLDGKVVLAQLERQRVSQQAFARFIRCSPAELSRVLHGDSVGPELVYRICLGLDQIRRGHRAE